MSLKAFYCKMCGNPVSSKQDQEEGVHYNCRTPKFCCFTGIPLGKGSFVIEKFPVVSIKEAQLQLKLVKEESLKPFRQKYPSLPEYTILELIDAREYDEDVFEEVMEKFDKYYNTPDVYVVIFTNSADQVKIETVTNDKEVLDRFIKNQNYRVVGHNLKDTISCIFLNKELIRFSYD